jgi:nucleoside-diphosphate-sugar epimerase
MVYRPAESKSPSRILVTGGTGFLGTALLRTLVLRPQSSLLVLTRDTSNARVKLHPLIESGHVELIEGDLHNAPFDRLQAFRPDTLAHLAWTTEHGRYLTSPDNERYLESSLALGDWALQQGVHTILGVGTCLEYGPTAEPMDELRTPLHPTSPYGQAKLALFETWQRACAADEVRFVWARVFYAFGPGEPPGSMVSRFLTSLTTGHEIVLRTPTSRKDFIYVQDVVEALTTMLDKGDGPYNIGLGAAIEIRQFAELLARMVDRSYARILTESTATPDPYPLVQAANHRLRELGWSPRFSVESGVRTLIEYAGSTGRTND